MAGLLFDTSVYINTIRSGSLDLILARNITSGNKRSLIYASSVVIEELYAGAIDPKIRKFIEKLERDIISAGRLLVPSHSDWQLSGHLLRQVGIKHGFEIIGKSRLTNDCLIAMSARRLGLTLVSANVNDFELISEFRKFDLEEF